MIAQKTITTGTEAKNNLLILRSPRIRYPITKNEIVDMMKPSNYNVAP